VAVVVLTGALIYVTNAYVKTTRQQVTAAEGQLKELRDARSATFRPVIHALSAGFHDADVDVARPYVRLNIANLGNGPAIDLILNDRDLFECEPARSSLGAREIKTLQLTSLSTKLPLSPFDVPLVYRDLENVRWLTTVGVNLSLDAPELRVTKNETSQP
jgi:hypothetical protein